MKAPSIQPNSTPLPHIIIREWMPRLTDVELRVLLVVVDQTLGWVEDRETGRRKREDWMSQSQLVLKTGRSRGQISIATKRLHDELGLIECVDSKGKLLAVEKRKRNFGKIFYRLSLHEPELTLFDNVRPNKAVFSRVGKADTDDSRVGISGTRNSDTTKETPLTKEINTMPAKPALSPEEKKRREDHKKFMEFFYETTEKTRGFKPKFSPADGLALKRLLLSGVDESHLEQMALFFLADPGLKKFTPSIATFASNGILTGLENRSRNDPEFHKQLDGYLTRLRPTAVPVATAVLRASMAKLMAKMRMPGSSEDRAHDAEEVSAAQRRGAYA